jgi:5-methylthioadenosine/S-adenosylhomocysteine deaminase
MLLLTLENIKTHLIHSALMLIKDVSLLRSGRLLKGYDILIEGNRIASIGRDLSADSSEEKIDGRGQLAIPGLVNAHTHLAMTLFRGYADDMALMPWLQEKIWPLESRLTAEDVRWGVKLGCLEMIRFGVTCYNDMYYFMDETAKATKEMGLRAFLSGVVFDSRPEFKREAEAFIKRWKGDDMICPAVGPHAIYTCSKDTLLWAKETAEKNDVMLHIHLSETRGEVEDSQKKHGKSPVEYLDSIGVLSPRVLAAHCVWLSDNDISLLANRGVNVAHCPVSNLKMAAGIAPLEKLRAAGVNVCIGADGASSNNNLDLFEEMKVAAIVQKNALSRPDVMKAEEVWRMGTENAYKAFNLDFGLRDGAVADLALINLRRPWFTPETNIVSHLIYGISGGVDTTIANGRVLMRDGVIPGEEEILKKAQERFEILTA